MQLNESMWGLRAESHPTYVVERPHSFPKPSESRATILPWGKTVDLPSFILGGSTLAHGCEVTVHVGREWLICGSTPGWVHSSGSLRTQKVNLRPTWDMAPVLRGEKMHNFATPDARRLEMIAHVDREWLSYGSTPG